MKYIRIIILGILFPALLSIGSVKAQLVVDNTITPESLVLDYFAGPGVQISNITFNGQPGNQLNPSIGLFNSENSNIPITSGLILSTGNIDVAVGPNNNGSATQGGSGLSGDQDLLTASGVASVNDYAILEFDFVPSGDSLVFRYVFASEEYNEFACSSVNDVFGFFISGPGITGPYSNNSMNIAVIPGTNTPVSINTINNGTDDDFEQYCINANPNFVEDSIYFIDNEVNQWNGWDPPEPPEDWDTTATQFDGFTVVLEAIANVICGETYHMKIGIADGGDFSYDSGVFLEAESFYSNTAIEAILETPVGVADSTIYEGCGFANLVFSRPGDSSIVETVYLTITGDAINGVDYTQLPDSIIFGVGVNEVSYQIYAPQDGIAEGQELVHIEIENVATTCTGNTITVTSDFHFYINEADPLAMELLVDGEIEACGDSVTLSAIPSGGYAQYKYLWNTGSTEQEITVSPGFTTTYTVTLTDTCDAVAVTKSVTIDVPVYPPLVVDAGEDQVVETCDTEAILMANAQGGYGEYEYTWKIGNTEIGTGQVISYIPDGAQNLIEVTVTDECGALATDEVLISVPPVEVTVNAGPDRIISTCLDPVIFDAFAYGGVGALTYDWYINNEFQETGPNFIVEEPQDSALVRIVATDECDNMNSDEAYILFDLPEIVLTLSPDVTICDDEETVISGFATGGVGELTYDWDDLADNEQQHEVAPNFTTNYYLTVSDECGQEVTDKIIVTVSQPQALFDVTPVDYYGIQFHNRSTSGEYLWEFGDGSSTTEINPTHLFTNNDRNTVVLTVIDEFGCMDSISYLAIPPMEVFIPNSFTPNGDGVNDLFKVVGVEIVEFEFRIFDRWGKEVYFSRDINDRWNGTIDGGNYLLPAGVYSYYLKIKGPREEESLERRGSINLIR